MMAELDARLSLIEARNARVEADKAWEVSFLRRFLVAALTYLFGSLFIYSTKNSDWYVAALWPCIGFWLSTISVNRVKEYWLKNHRS